MRAEPDEAAGWPEVDELVRHLAEQAGVAPADARLALSQGRRVRPSLRWRLRRHRQYAVDARREMLLIGLWMLLLLLSLGATAYVSYFAR